MGSGDARLEAVRFAWPPGLRYENMLEGAMGGRWRGGQRTTTSGRWPW